MKNGEGSWLLALVIVAALAVPAAVRLTPTPADPARPLSVGHLRTGMTRQQVIDAMGGRGRPAQSSLCEGWVDEYEWRYGEVGKPALVTVEFEHDRTRALSGTELCQDGRRLLGLGDRAARVLAILGPPTSTVSGSVGSYRRWEWRGDGLMVEFGSPPDPDSVSAAVHRVALYRLSP